MGRRKDPEQAAKGYPGRRRKRIEAEIAAAAEAAEREVPSGDRAAPPTIFTQAPVYYRRALQLWVQLSKVLETGGRRRPGYRSALTRYCLWSQYHEQAATTLRRDCPNGELTMVWKMGHGAEKVLPHPSFRILEAAEPILRALEGEFGFTPRADADLGRVESFNASQRRLPFDETPQPGSVKPSDQVEPDAMSLMTSTDTRPLPN
jgi:phage terminase small subunit